jgi:hypothetical protein
MSLEQFKEPIVAENIEEHDRLLQEQVRKAQLLFTESKFQNEASIGLKYSDVLEAGTNLVSTISMIYWAYLEKKEGKKSKELEGRFEEFKKNIIADIDRIAESTSGEERIGKVLDYLNAKFNEYYEKRDSEHDNHVGLIGYGRKVSPVSRLKQLENTGLKPDDDYLGIHFAAAFKNDKEPGSGDIKKWLSELAEIIIDKFPETKAVVGTSWLFDHPIMKRFGFKVVEDKADGENWQQMTNKEGQIDTARLESAIKNGRLPFKNLTGYVLIEDFLKKYLPENRKGEIILKEVDPEYFNVKNDVVIQKERLDLIELIKNTPQELINIDLILEKIPGIIKIAKEKGVEKEIVELFEHCLNNKIPLLEIDRHPELLKYKKFTDKVFSGGDDKKYIERKIVI